MKWYSGIGSCETPAAIIQQMEELAAIAATHRYGLRSGAAKGADQAFERGCDSVYGAKEIYVPNQSFMPHRPATRVGPSEQALKLAATVHPVWNKLGGTARLLIARNMHQVLGTNLDDPVEMVICWTSDGCTSKETYSMKTGGTGAAISLASSLDIPVYNLYHPNVYLQLRDFIIPNCV